MQYVLTPLHKHYDSGFGATANAFKDAADFLDRTPEAKKDNLFNANLPINFLYRHAIELYLKSAIVIFHRRLQLPFGTSSHDSEPMVLVAGTWKPFYRVHDIEHLWTYVKQLFAEHAKWLAENTPVNWGFSADFETAMKLVHDGDPKSTFFRYPTTQDIAKDSDKSAMKDISESDLLAAAAKSEETGKRVFALVIQNEGGEFVRAFNFVSDGPTEFDKALRTVSEELYSMHAAMRAEMCDGA